MSGNFAKFYNIMAKQNFNDDSNSDNKDSSHGQSNFEPNSDNNRNQNTSKIVDKVINNKGQHERLNKKFGNTRRPFNNSNKGNSRNATSKRNAGRNNANRVNANSSNDMLTVIQYNIKNYSGDMLSSKHNNYFYSLYDQQYNESSTSINVALKIKILPKKIRTQANVYAQQLLQQQDVRFNYLFGNNSDLWIQKAMELYIYSCVKGMLLGFNWSRVKERYGNSHLLVGHAINTKILATRKFTNKYGGLWVNFDIYNTQEEIDEIYDLLVLEFPFLNNCIVNESGYGFNVINSEYERYLGNLANHRDYSQGNIVIDLLEEDSSVEKYLLRDSNPLGNSILYTKPDGEDGFLYASSGMNQVTEPSVSICRANFYTLRGDEPKFGSSPAFDFIRFTEADIFAKHDASSICGFKIRYNPNNDADMVLNGTTFKGPNPAPFLSYEAPSGTFGTRKPNISANSKPVQPSDQSGSFDEDEDDISIYEDEDSLRKNLNSIMKTQFKLADKSDIPPDVGILFEKTFGDILENHNIYASEHYIFPYKISPDMDILNTFDVDTVLKLNNYITKYGLRFDWDDFIFNDKSKTISTSDNSIKVTFDKRSFDNTLNKVTLDQVLQVASIAWLSKNQKLISYEMFIGIVNSRFNGAIYYQINKNYDINVVNGNVNIDHVGNIKPGILPSRK